MKERENKAFDKSHDVSGLLWFIVHGLGLSSFVPSTFLGFVYDYCTEYVLAILAVNI